MNESRSEQPTESQSPGTSEEIAPESGLKMGAKIWLSVISVLVVLSLLLNGVLLFALIQVRKGALDAITAARHALFALSQEPFTTQVSVDQSIPFNTSVPIDQTISAPLDFEYPLSTVVNTSINIPLLGQQEIVFPVESIIPISYTIEVPVQMNIPISLTYRLQTEVPVSVEIPPNIQSNIDGILVEIENALK